MFLFQGRSISEQEVRELCYIILRGEYAEIFGEFTFRVAYNQQLMICWFYCHLNHYFVFVFVVFRSRYLNVDVVYT